jgi:hypothetical protein
LIFQEIDDLHSSGLLIEEGGEETNVPTHI